MALAKTSNENVAYTKVRGIVTARSAMKADADAAERGEGGDYQPKNKKWLKT
jgi:hypothetical protein